MYVLYVERMRLTDELSHSAKPKASAPVSEMCVLAPLDIQCLYICIYIIFCTESTT